MKQYSDKELKMIEFFGYGNIAQEQGVTAIVLYRMMVEKAFAENLHGPAVESLRRCFNAFEQHTLYRMTPEWDAMIDLETPVSPACDWTKQQWEAWESKFTGCEEDLT